MYLDAQEQIMSSVSKVIVDQKNGSNLLYLPLDKLMVTTGANVPQAPAVTPPAQPNPTTTVAPNSYTDNRARDDSRSRDRDSR
jgi:membrane protease subunit HflK